MIKAQKSRKNEEISTIWASRKNCVQLLKRSQWIMKPRGGWSTTASDTRRYIEVYLVKSRGSSSLVTIKTLLATEILLEGTSTLPDFYIHPRAALKGESGILQSRTWDACLSSLQSPEKFWWPSPALTCTPIDFSNKLLCHISKVAAVGYREGSPVLWVYCSLNVICYLKVKDNTASYNLFSLY